MRADLDAFLEHLRSERQVSAHTLDGYRRDLLKTLALAEKAGLSDWNALDTRSLRTFVARLHQQGQSSRSLARLLSATRGLYQYLLREGRCRHDPANGLSAPKSPRKLPRTLDADRALQLLDGAVEDDFIARRDQALLEAVLFLRAAPLGTGRPRSRMAGPQGRPGASARQGQQGPRACRSARPRARRSKPGCRCAPRPLRKTVRCSSAAAASA